MMHRVLTTACLFTAALVLSCGRRATVVPNGIAASLTAASTIEDIIKSADPEATVLGGRSGGGGGGGSTSLVGSSVHASYSYTYTGRIRSEKNLAEILDVLRRELRADIAEAGGKIHGQGGGPTTGRWAPGQPMRTLRTGESLRFKRNGFQVDVFFVMFPVSEPKTSYALYLHVVEMLIGK